MVSCSPFIVQISSSSKCISPAKPIDRNVKTMIEFILKIGAIIKVSGVTGGCLGS